MLAVLGSTTNFDMPPEELEKFKKQHSLNGGSAGGSTEEDEEDEDYPESLVYVNSPKVGKTGQLVVTLRICTSASAHSNNRNPTVPTALLKHQQ